MENLKTDVAKTRFPLCTTHQVSKTVTTNYFMAAIAVMRDLQTAQIIPATGESKKARIDPSNLTLSIHRIAKEIRPSLSVSKEMIETINDLLLDVLVKVVKSGDAIAAYGSVITLNTKEIQGGVRSILPDVLLPAALKAAEEACDNYDPKILNPPKRGEPKAPAPRKTGLPRSERADLTLPIPRVETLIRSVPKIQTTRLGEGAPVYLAAVLDFLARRLLIDAGEITLSTKIHLIKQEHLVAAMEKDAGLRELFAHWLLIRPILTGEETPAPVPSTPQSSTGSTPAPVPAGN